MTNKYLALVRSVDRVDHRSHAERGLDEQPTIHEGVTARALERKGIVSDRCELNRRIKADNVLLRELKATVRKLTDAVKVAIPAVAEALENIRAHMVVLQYRLLHNRVEIKDVSGRIDWNQPLVDEYRSVKKEIREKQAQKEELLTQKKNASIFNPIRFLQINQQITTLTEEIEELKTRRSQLMHEVGCQNETQMKEAEGTLTQMSAYVEKLTAQQETLTSQLAADEAQYRETEATVTPEQADALLDARASLRSSFRDQIRSKLREMFGQKFQYDRLSSAEEQIDSRLGEDADSFQKRAAKLRHEQEMERRRNHPKQAKKKSREHER